MREIKFRGKRVDNGEWVFGNFISVSKETNSYKTELTTGIQVIEDGIFKCVHQVKEDSVGQFSGLHDKNGKEIFEGDIIKKCGYNKKERQWIKYYRVIYEYDAFCLEKDGETYAFGFSKDGKLIKEEIIGNIHETAIEQNQQ